MFCPPDVGGVMKKNRVKTFKGCSGLAKAVAKRDGMRMGRKFLRK